jgi:porin
VDWGISVGVGGRGLIPDRGNDTWGVGYAYCNIRDVRFVTNRFINSEAQRVEAYYDAEITPSIHLSGHVNRAQPLLSDVDDALALSLRLRISL